MDSYFEEGESRGEVRRKMGDKQVLEIEYDMNEYDFLFCKAYFDSTYNTHLSLPYEHPASPY